MKKMTMTAAAMILLNSTGVWAYGSSSSSKKVCKKPVFSQFSPEHLTEVQAQSQFSFDASSSTDPSSIRVTVKKLPVEVKIEQMGGGYQVSGLVPAELAGKYARVQIKAKGINNCPGSDGWLLKVIP
jgi:hypothetical protein